MNIRYRIASLRLTYQGLACSHMVLCCEQGGAVIRAVGRIGVVFLLAGRSISAKSSSYIANPSCISDTMELHDLSTVNL